MSASFGNKGRIQKLGPGQVKVKGGFWGKLLKQYTEYTLGYIFDMFDYSHSFDSFDYVARGERKLLGNTSELAGKIFMPVDDNRLLGKKDGAWAWKEEPWRDALIYGTIAAAGEYILSDGNKKKFSGLIRRISRYVDQIYQAGITATGKDAKGRVIDGYFTTINLLERTSVLDEAEKGALWNHDLYIFGALAEAGLYWYLATGDSRLLFLATRFAEFLVDYLYGTEGQPPVMHVPPHQICEEALLNIYDFYKNHPSEVRKMEKTYAFAEGLDPHDRYADLKIRYPEYLRMCNDWITQRGIHDNRFQNVDYGAYAQDDKTYDQITEAMGHAVRANLWYSSFARIGGYTGNADYVKAAKTLWDNIVKKQMYVTGGTGARGESFGEDYAGNYMLPQNGYCETCASVAMAFYADNMFSVFGDAQYQDILELEMYNGILGSLSLKGNAFYYQNPLVSQDYERPSWSGLTPCCPPMYMKFFGFLPSYIYSVRSDNLYVNQYIGSVATCKVGKTKVKLTQKTDMPNGRKASFAVSGTGRFTLKLRRPSWAKGVLLTVCGQTKPAKAGADGYINIDRTWNDGDTVSVEFEKVVERLYQNKVVYNRGQVAIKYGPFVYCAESEDNPFTGGMTFDSVIFALPKGNSFKAHLDNQAFRIEYNGKAVPLAVVTLKSTVQLKSNGSITKQPLKLVPFFVRGNRNNRGMKVWLNEEKNK